jgi:hypothetical protein
VVNWPRCKLWEHDPGGPSSRPLEAPALTGPGRVVPWTPTGHHTPTRLSLPADLGTSSAIPAARLQQDVHRLHLRLPQQDGNNVLYNEAFIGYNRWDEWATPVWLVRA